MFRENCGRGFSQILLRHLTRFIIGSYYQNMSHLARDKVIRWIRSISTVRTYRAADALSEETRITSGVPQWSVIGPLLSLLFVNDLPCVISVTTMFLCRRRQDGLTTLTTRPFGGMPPHCLELDGKFGSLNQFHQMQLHRCSAGSSTSIKKLQTLLMFWALP